MCYEIKAWKTRDGKLFESSKAASEYELERAIKNIAALDQDGIRNVLKGGAAEGLREDLLLLAEQVKCPPVRPT